MPVLGLRGVSVIRLNQSKIRLRRVWYCFSSSLIHRQIIIHKATPESSQSADSADEALFS